MINLGKIFALDHVSLLLPLPCGCVAESNFYSQFGYFECPWCEAMFEREAYGQWLNDETSADLHMNDGPRSLLRHDGRLFEIIGECGDDPVVQMDGDLIAVHQFDWVSN